MAKTVAAVCVLGHAGPGAFAASVLSMPEIEGIRSNVELRLFEPELPPPNDNPARATITLDDGRTLVGECLSAPGGPDRPLPHQVILEKASALAQPVYPRFGEEAARLVALESSVVSGRWGDVVDQITAGSSP